jgi:hypothetical protein
MKEASWISEYKISMGPVARTLVYEDSSGALRFTFDVETANNKTTIFLDPKMKTIIQSAQARIDLAYERTKQYLVSRGYEIGLT